MELPDRVLYWLASSNKEVAAEVEASQLGRRAWLAVFPKHSRLGGASLNKPYYLVVYTEVERDVLDLAEKEKRSIENKERLNQEILEVEDISQIPKVLSRWLDDLTKLVQPYFCDYPF